MSADASAQSDVGNIADIAYTAGDTSNFVSRCTFNDATITTGVQQLKIIGVSRDPDHSDLTSALS